MKRKRSLGTLLRLAGLSLLAPPLAVFAASDAEYAARRNALVDGITASQSGAPGGFEASVVAAMRRVPRHLFVPEPLRARAYENRPLSIGHGQTISQPYIVALMTDLLKLRRGDRVLEIGTGSGYQAAVLSVLVKSVYTIEIVEPLAREARERLAKLGYANVEVRTGDGYKGWPEHAPFDAIMVTAGAPHVPPALVEQLKPGGRMVIPVGPASMIQSLKLIEKKADGSIETRDIVPVVFVPLTRTR